MSIRRTLVVAVLVPPLAACGGGDGSGSAGARAEAGAGADTDAELHGDLAERPDLGVVVEDPALARALDDAARAALDQAAADVAAREDG